MDIINNKLLEYLDKTQKLKNETLNGNEQKDGQINKIKLMRYYHGLAEIELYNYMSHIRDNHNEESLLLLSTMSSLVSIIHDYVRETEKSVYNKFQDKEYEYDIITLQIPSDMMVGTIDKFNTFEQDFFDNQNSDQAEFFFEEPVYIGTKKSGIEIFDVAFPTLILFWAHWCPASLQFLSEWKKFKSVVGGIFSQLQILDVDAGHDDEKSKELIKLLDVKAYPTLIYFHRGLIDRIVGSTTKENIIDMLKSNS